MEVVTEPIREHEHKVALCTSTRLGTEKGRAHAVGTSLISTV